MDGKRKALVAATVGRFLKFEENDIRLLKEGGYEVHCAANFTLEKIDQIPELDVIRHQIDFARSPFSKNTYTAYKQLCQLLKEQHFDLIHCHTPVGGILTRLSARKYRKNGTKVYYTAHGFHFYKGAPFVNWILYFPAEWLCSWWTDVLITINTEDFNRAKKSLHAKKIEYIPGIGIDIEKFQNLFVDKIEKRKEIHIPADATLLISVGELNKNKNHEIVIRAISKINNSNIYYVIAGTGDYHGYLVDLIEKLGLKNQVFLLGYRDDIPELYKCADVCVFPSIREGLGLAAIEGMAAGLPLICSDNRGTREYAFDENNAMVCRFNSVEEYAQAIQKLYRNKEFSIEMGKGNMIESKKFDMTIVKDKMKEIYKLAGYFMNI